MTTAEHEEWLDLHTWNPSRDSALELQSDLVPAGWIGPLLVPGSFEVRMTAPQGFDAYARIFFPFEGTDVDSGESVQLSWSEVALRNRRVAHPLMESETILETPDGAVAPFTVAPSMAVEQVEALTTILASYTSSTEAWFLLWEGFGDLNRCVFDRWPTVDHPMRSCYLLRGPLDSYGELPHDPNYWWPADRAWCVSSDVDFDWSYLAGPVACVADVVAEPVLDALETRPEYPAVAGMDVLNEPEADRRPYR